jgi:hypothetical protein
MRIGLLGPINHLSNGLYIQYKYFYFVIQACLLRQEGTIKDFGPITRAASASRLEGRRGGTKGTPGFRAAGSGCGLSSLLRRADVATRAALAFTD